MTDSALSLYPATRAGRSHISHAVEIKMFGRGLPAPLFSTPDAPADLGCCPAVGPRRSSSYPVCRGQASEVSVHLPSMVAPAGLEPARSFAHAHGRGSRGTTDSTWRFPYNSASSRTGPPARVAATVNLVIKPVATARVEKPSRRLYLGPFPRRAPFGLAVLSRRSLWLNGTPPRCFVGWGCLSILHHGA